MKRSVLCLMSISCLLRGAAGSSFDYVPFEIGSAGAASSDLAKIMEGGVRHVMRAHELGAGDGAEARIEKLISSWQNAVEEAKKSVSRRGTFELPGAYKQRVKRVLRRLKLLKAVVDQMLQEEVEAAREYLFNIGNILTSSYKNWSETIEANLEPFRNYPALQYITPVMLYKELGIDTNITDPSEFDVAFIQGLVDTKALKIALEDQRAAESFKRQMRYLFGNAMSKEAYDAWLNGQESFLEWQQSTLSDLGLDASKLAEIAIVKGLSLISFKAELTRLQREIQDAIDEITTATAV